MAYNKQSVIGKTTSVEIDKVCKDGVKRTLINGFVLDQTTGEQMCITLILNTQDDGKNKFGFKPNGNFLLKGTRSQKQYDNKVYDIKPMTAKFELATKKVTKNSKEVVVEVESDTIPF